MERYKLGELIDVTRGASLPGDNYATEGELIRLTLGNFDYKSNGFKENTSKDDIYYNGEVDEAYILEKGDIITPLTEQAIGLLGSTAKVPESGKYIQSQDVALVKVISDKLVHDFAYFLLPTASVKKQLSAGAQQTSIRHTSPDKIKDCTVFLPDPKDQQKIADFLNQIEDKIALNRKENATLEAMAKQLYDYWFVQFDFPDANGKPYKSSGGKMVYNETLKREIPENWGVCQLGDIVEECAVGTCPNELSENLYYTPIDTMPAKTMSFSSFAPLSEAQSSLCLYKKWNILLGSMRVYFHKVCIAPFDGVTRTTAIVLRPKTDGYLPYCYQVINEDEFIKYATIMSNGSQQPCLAWSSVVNRPIIRPDVNIVKGYCEQCSELVNRVVNSQKEQAELESLRNFTLPLLMSGQAML